jgi:uncharacterized protein DUF6353
MKLSIMKNAITSKAARQVLVARKHSPTILFAAGVIGVVGTVVLASRATLKLEDVLLDAQEDLDKAKNLEHTSYSEEDRRNDVVIIYVQTAAKLIRMYAPAVVLGGLSITALTGSHMILNRRNTALMAAYAVLDKGFREYRQRVVENLGVEKDREFRYGGEERTIVFEGEHGPETTVVKDVISGAPSIYARVFDQACSSWSPSPGYNQMFIQCQQNYANDRLRAVGHLFLNEVYDMLGMPRSKEGAVVGWLIGCDSDNYVDFGVFEGDRYSGMRFVKGDTNAIWLDFNVDGVIYDKI